MFRVYILFDCENVLLSVDIIYISYILKIIYQCINMSSLLTEKDKILPTEYVLFNSVDNLIEESHVLERNLVSNQETLHSIQKEYFNADNLFDICRFELVNVPKLLNSNEITTYCEKLVQQHYVVSKKVLSLVLQKQFQFQMEFQNIVEIKKKLADIITVCKTSRDELSSASHQFTSCSLKIFYYCRKRKILENLLNILYIIRSLYHTKNKLQQLLCEENYPEVISLISECQKAAETYKKYQSVVALYDNLHDILEQVEENLDLSLSNITTHFNIDNYSSIEAAYHFLGKSETILDQLHMHFTAAIHNTAHNTIIRYAKDDYNKQYNYLCKCISLNNFLSCLVELCKSLLIILKSYSLIIKYYENYNNIITKRNSYENLYLQFNEHNFSIILQKLYNGIIKICSDIENKIVIYMDGFDLLPLKFEEFIEVLTIISRMIKIGSKISKSNMIKLHDSTKEKILHYFKSYHASQLDELKIFLENDGWKLCPIKHTFKCTDLLEFKRFKNILNLSPSSEDICKNLHDIENHGINNWSDDYINNLMSSTYMVIDEFAEEHISEVSMDKQRKHLSDDSDDEIPEELKYDCVDDVNKENIQRNKRQKFGPIVTNTTLSVLRICGKYLQITQYFKDITKTVVQYMIQLFELYFYSVHSFFTVDFINNDFVTVYVTNMKRTISRIKDYLITEHHDNIEDLNHKVHQPYLSSIIDLNDPNKLYGLTERIVAVESLIFLGRQYDFFRIYISTIMLHDQEQFFLNQFYLQTIALTIALRKPVYMAAISKAFNVCNVLSLMNKVNWELKDVISQHSRYIDFLVEEMLSFKTKLLDIQNNVPLCKEVCESIWESVAYLITHTLVEGFSNVKKCSNGGRALMQLDLTQFISKFESITSLRPMPHQDYVASYIKAYYLPESSIELWIKTNSEMYSTKHLTGLISCMYQSRKIKQKLINLIEDQRIHR